MKTWLKGGLWGIIVWILLIITGLLIALFSFEANYSISFIAFPCILFFIGESGMQCFIYGPILNLIISFILGSIIGLIIQKIKSKNNDE